MDAKKNREAFGEKVKEKREAINSITPVEATRVALFKEFLSKELSTPECKKSQDVFDRFKSLDKKYQKVNEKKYIMDHIKAVIINEINNNRDFAIYWYMNFFEKEKEYCIFEKKDFEEITKYMFEQIQLQLQPIREILNSWENSKRQDNWEKYYKDIMDPEFGEKIISLLNNPMLVWLINTFFHFFERTLWTSSRLDFHCSKEELNWIFKIYEEKYKEILATSGKIKLLKNFLKAHEYSYGNEYIYYGVLKWISIARWDYRAVFDCLKCRHLELSAKEIHALAINRQREEEKEEIIKNIMNVITEINQLAGEKLFETNDYYIRDDDSSCGKLGRPLMKHSIKEIGSEYLKFIQIASDLKKKKNTWIADIISALTTKPEKAISNNSKNSTKKNKKNI